MRPAQPVLEVTAVRKRFGEGQAAVEAVRGVDLTLKTGEIVLVMGPSGSGKTTLLSMLGALLRPSAGEIRLDGVPLHELTERELPALRAEKIGFIFQDFNLMPSLTARENVEVALNVAGTVGREAHARATGLLAELGLSERLDFLPEKLSGGEKQRVAIARALANEPALVLADEPTANLDSSIGRDVMRLLREIASRHGQSVLIVSHDSRIKQFADRVLWLEDGTFKETAGLVVDPICGMQIDPQESRHQLTVDGITHWFCCQGCLDEFEGRQRERTQRRAYATSVEAASDAAES